MQDDVEVELPWIADIVDAKEGFGAKGSRDAEEEALEWGQAEQYVQPRGRPRRDRGGGHETARCSEGELRRPERRAPRRFRDESLG